MPSDVMYRGSCPHGTWWFMAASPDTTDRRVLLTLRCPIGDEAVPIETVELAT